MEYIGKNIDKYRITDFIGEGGFSHVYLAWDTRMLKRVAIKVFKNNEESMKEAKILENLSHPGLVKIYDIITDDEAAYLIMEYVKGTSLKDVLLKSGRLCLEDALNYTKQLCDIFEYLHRNHPPIVYGDLKPSNIIITPENNVRLIDFGAATDSEQEGYCVTAGYSAPEYFNGGKITPACDIYGIGVLLYEMITGIGPRNAYFLKPLSAVDITSDKNIDTIIRKAVAFERKERYETVSLLRYDLENVGKIKKRFDLQSGLKKLVLVLCAMVTVGSFLVPMVTKDITDINLWDVMESMLSVTVFFLLRKALLKSVPRNDFDVITKKEIYLTSKKYKGLYLGLGVAIGVSVAVFINWPHPKMAYANESKQNLWVEMKDTSERKMLLKPDCTYEVKDMVRFEIPAEAIPTDNLNIRIVATTDSGEEYESRVFTVCNK